MIAQSKSGLGYHSCMSTVSLILLAGGSGSRMGGGIPKQFRLLQGKPLILYSFEFFSSLPEVNELVVVCESSYRDFFKKESGLRFALPGKRRQDSVYNGLRAASEEADLICVHDGARPFVDRLAFLACLRKAEKEGAAALAVPASNTIKRVDGDRVVQTLPRQDLWEMQTPQVIQRKLFSEAYEYANSREIEATDDLSLVEAFGHPVYLIKSSPENFKVTTPFDWSVAESLCASR